MSYRIEISPNNRATCSATKCKNEGIKILKGEIRQSVTVMFQDKQSWKHRHWGCVTPEVIHNWQGVTEGDMELVDGFEGLPDDAKEKVKRALEQGHVDDEDWKGDLECNRLTGKKNQGMFVKTPKKKDADEDDNDNDNKDVEESPTKKKGGRKRKPVQDDVADQEPKPKKARGKKTAKDDEEDDDAGETLPTKRGRKSKKAANDEELNESTEPAAKVTKGKNTKAVLKNAADTNGGHTSAKKPEPAKKAKAKKVAAKAVDTTDEPEAELGLVKGKPQKRKAKGKKATVEDE